MVKSGTLIAAPLLLIGITPQLASADSGTRTINSYVTCADGTLIYGFAINYGTGWTYTALGASGYQVNSYEKEVTFIVPSTATSVALDTYCGLYTYLYGAVERSCTLDSIAYG
jgi:hypothetical protein